MGPESTTILGLQPGSLADWVSGLFTAAGVLFALYREAIGGWLKRPKLRLRAECRIPHCSLTKANRQIADGSGILETTIFYVRLYITNEGGSPARTVQVHVGGLRRDLRGRATPEPELLPMYLRATHGRDGATFIDSISPGMGRHVDLGHVASPGTAGLYHLPRDFDRDRPWFSLATEVEPFTGTNILKPGRYEIDVTIVAANVTAESYTLELNFRDFWSTDENEMFDRGPTLRVLRKR
jgi:hypothetical protein